MKLLFYCVAKLRFIYDSAKKNGFTTFHNFYHQAKSCITNNKTIIYNIYTLEGKVVDRGL